MFMSVSLVDVFESNPFKDLNSASADCLDYDFNPFLYGDEKSILN